MHRTCYTYFNITEFLLIYNHVNQALAVIADIQLRAVLLRLIPLYTGPRLHYRYKIYPHFEPKPHSHKSGVPTVVLPALLLFPFPSCNTGHGCDEQQSCCPTGSPVSLHSHSQQSSHSQRVHDSSYWKKKKKIKEWHKSRAQVQIFYGCVVFPCTTNQCKRCFLQGASYRLCF